MKQIKYILCAAVLVSMVSCNKFLDEYSQDLYYVHNWGDLDELLIGSAYMDYEKSYAPSSWGDSHYGQFIHLLTDDIDENTYGVSQEYDCQDVYFGNFTWQPRTGIKSLLTEYNAENTTWTRCYYHINVCNNIIASLKEVPNETDEEHLGCHKVSGEAHFIRAYLYFFLVNLYGKPYDENAATNPGVPLKLSENVEDKKYTRNTVKEIYDQVLSDLEIARSELSQYTTGQKNYFRADSVAADLLTARVYLYMQDWQNAYKYATKVIDEHPALEDLNSPSDTYFHSKSNVENIFSMGGDDVTPMLQYSIKSLTATKDLYNMYEANDLRKSKWFWTMGDFVGLTQIPQVDSYWGTTYASDNPSFYNYMYSEGNLGANTYFSTVFGMRSAEAYLIKAESAAYLGRENMALSTLNYLRSKRYNKYRGTGYTLSSTGEQLIQDIRDERRREFCFEGHRWFDLRRYTVNSVYKESHEIIHTFTVYADRESTTPTQRRRYTLKAYDDAYTLPIPNEVIKFNTGMQQNTRPEREPEVIEIN